jgi:hypothetical protein
MPETDTSTPQQHSEVTIKPDKKSVNWKLLGVIIIIAVIIIGGLAYAVVVLDIFGRKVQEPTSITKASTTSAKAEKAVYETKILATLPPEDPNILYNVILDPQDKTTAYSIEDGAKSSSTIVINGNKGRTYDEIKELTLSPDGKRVAFVATKDSKTFVVVDGQEGKKYDYIKNLKFSPDSQHFAYAAGEGVHFVPDSPYSGSDETKSMVVVVDGTEKKTYEGTLIDMNIPFDYDPFFSKDGKKITYNAIKNGKNIVVLDDKELSQYSNPRFPRFIGDTYDIVYLASEGSKDFLVVGGNKKQAHDYIHDLETPIFVGENADQIAYGATDNNSKVVIVNDVSYTITSGTLSDFSFSNAGKYFAYYTSNGPTNRELFVNGKNTARLSGTTTSPLFSHNDQLLVYSEFFPQNLFLRFMTTDPLKKLTDISLSGFKGSGLLRFSDDGKYLYFKGWQGRNIVFVTVNVTQLTKN